MVLISVKDCFELERSNLLLHTVNNNVKRLKFASEELLKARLERKNKEKRKKARQDSLKEEDLKRQIPIEAKELKEERWQHIKKRRNKAGKMFHQLLRKKFETERGDMSYIHD